MSHYTAQETGSACSVAGVAMTVNALRGLPPLSSDRLVTETRVLNEVSDDGWKAASAENGDGVSFGDFAGLVRKSVDAFGLEATVEVFRPKDTWPETLEGLRRILEENERNASGIILRADDQGSSLALCCGAARPVVAFFRSSSTFFQLSFN